MLNTITQQQAAMQQQQIAMQAQLIYACHVPWKYSLKGGGSKLK